MSALFENEWHNTRLIRNMHSDLPNFQSLPIVINVLFFLFEIIPCFRGFALSENMKRHLSRQIQVHVASTTLSSSLCITLTRTVIYLSIIHFHTAMWALFENEWHNTRLILNMHSDLPKFLSLPIVINVLFFLFEIIPCFRGFAVVYTMKKITL